MNPNEKKPAKRKKTKGAGQRTMEAMRKKGYTVGVVERWNAHCRIRQDLFGFIDLVSFRQDIGIVAVQCTTYTQHKKHRDKIFAEPRARGWLESGARLLLVSWQKVEELTKQKDLFGEPKKRFRWLKHTEEITLDMFPPVSPPSR